MKTPVEIQQAAAAFASEITNLENHKERVFAKSCFEAGYNQCKADTAADKDEAFPNAGYSMSDLPVTNDPAPDYAVTMVAESILGGTLVSPPDSVQPGQKYNADGVHTVTVIATTESHIVCVDKTSTIPFNKQRTYFLHNYTLVQ